MIFARRNGRLNKRRSSRERTKTKDGNFFRSFLLSNRSGGRLDGQTARDDVSGENCIVVGEDDASARIMKWKDMIWKVHLRGLLVARRRAFRHRVVLSGTHGTHAREGGELESCFSTRNSRHSEKLFYVLINDDRRDKVQLNFSFFFPFFRELLKTRDWKKARRGANTSNTKKLFSRVPKVFLLFFHSSHHPLSLSDMCVGNWCSLFAEEDKSTHVRR